eukprot:COSAG01_NODE_3651_length_5823_cov_43.348821_7_plen_81_part_00
MAASSGRVRRAPSADGAEGAAQSNIRQWGAGGAPGWPFAPPPSISIHYVLERQQQHWRLSPSPGPSSSAACCQPAAIPPR